MIPLDFLRGLSDQYRPEAWSVQRATETAAGDGTTQSWSTIASGASGCRISTRSESGDEQLGGDQSIQAAGRRIVWLPPLTDVTPRDRIVSGGRTFEVQDVQARSYEAERACVCREIT